MQQMRFDGLKLRLTIVLGLLELILDRFSMPLTNVTVLAVSRAANRAADYLARHAFSFGSPAHLFSI